MKGITSVGSRLRAVLAGGVSLAQRYVLVAVAVLALGSSAFATGPCDSLNTVLGGTTIDMSVLAQAAVGCIFNSLTPGALIIVVIGLFLPVIVMVWMLRGSFALGARVVASAFSFMIRRG